MQIEVLSIKNYFKFFLLQEAGASGKTEKELQKQCPKLPLPLITQNSRSCNHGILQHLVTFHQRHPCQIWYP